ncbi:unnamed protein product [Pelagomonas calceolata]|uniref:Uncharacterized protein n=1 Tax=Pelagomonas calceolata TaxID=35677 RepID=A0A8J2S4A2_9STRA|nr:unnamed protein product [Pelagomonas calceolata]
MKWCYAWALYGDDDATLDDLFEAVETLEDTERIARRVLGDAHPTTTGIKSHLRDAQATLDTFLDARDMESSEDE